MATSKTDLTVAEKVAVFAQQHTALTRELDEVHEAMTDLPNLENALEYMCTSIASAESRITKGREKLRKEWRAHADNIPGSGIGSIIGKKKAEDAQKQFKLQQELAVYEGAMLRWNTEEAEVLEMKRQHVQTMEKVYELRDRVEPYYRLCSHLDNMYEVVFDGVKLDSAEGQFFEWQVRCAKNDNASLGGQIETAIQRLKQLSSLHTTVCEIERHLSRIEPLAAQFHNWPQLSPTANKEDKRVLTMAGLFGLIERSKTKFLEESKQLKELPGPPIQIPTITFISTIPATGVISIDNTTIQARYTLGGKQDEDADERLRSSISSARFALQILLIERDSAQRRADRLMTETSRLQEVLRTEGERRRAMRRTIFERTLREIRQHPVTTNANAIGTVSVPSSIGMPNLGIVSSQEGSGMHAHAVSAYFSTESTVTDDLPLLPPAYSKRITNARTTS